MLNRFVLIIVSDSFITGMQAMKLQLIPFLIEVIYNLQRRIL